MEKNKIVECIGFLSKLNIYKTDVTTEAEKANGQMVLVVEYHFEENHFKTHRLHYKNINLQRAVKDRNGVNQFFGEPVYWLDIDKHSWPQGKGARIESVVIRGMINDGDAAFEGFLKKLANDHKNGIEQLITWEGRSPHYSINLENNNHWHDVIILIQEIIRSKGNEIDRKFFSHLVFEWDNDERTSLHPRFGGRALLQHLYKNIKSVQMDLYHSKIISLLKHNHQIILQGPPGTGKTRLAKLIAEEITKPVPEPPGNNNEKDVPAGTMGEMKLIQFHPAYSYEDFVRGITAKSNGSQVEYRTENRILADFAVKALNNYKDHKKNKQTFSKEQWVQTELQSFADSIQEAIDKDGKYAINENVSIFEVQSDAFRYVGNNWLVNNKQRMKFADLVLEYMADAKNQQDVKIIPGISGRSKEHSSYDFKLLEKFRTFLQGRPPYAASEVHVELNSYVLIIDEINRANLPTVLGELIYALEYRGEAVESMYELDGSREIILPPNLYIIGTMNTADRSVGHIDYAIRRRFAFIDVLPDVNVIDRKITDPSLNKKVKTLFNSVSKLFNERKESNMNEPLYLQADFRAKDVQLGHSYFLVDNEEQLQLRLEFEIKPLLNEYVKDGILHESALEEIRKL